jgi:hypothetical protein
MMVIFVMLNINKEGSKMSKKETLIGTTNLKNVSERANPADDRDKIILS